MKAKRFMSLVFALIFAFSAFQIFSFADDAQACTHSGGNVTVIIDGNVSAEAEARIRAHFCEECDESAAQTRGLTCTLFGHDLETGTTQTITHKARTIAPRCLQETYDYEICSRCDYENYTVIKSVYIYCCS